MSTHSKALRLSYHFTSTPNPIRASTVGAAPNVVDVQVMISNTQFHPITIAEIDITIHIGENTGSALTSATSLPQITGDPSGLWNISANGGTITLVPASGSTIDVTDSIVFTIQQVNVNEQPGDVAIRVTESYGDSGATGEMNHSLTKLPSDFPVSSFFATPSVLNDLEQTVTLYWTCTSDSARRGYSYNVRSENLYPNGWPGRDCLASGDCYGCSDGAQGVVSPPLLTSATFLLDVIETTADGGRRKHATLYTHVAVTVPHLADSRPPEAIGSGQLVRMKWLFLNTLRCDVQLDGVTIESNVPADTYVHGHILSLNTTPGPHELSVIPYSSTGAHNPVVFSYSVGPTVNRQVAAWSRGLALSSDSRLALVSGSGGERAIVEFFDIATKAFEDTPNAVMDRDAGTLAITPDGSLAVVAQVMAIYREGTEGWHFKTTTSCIHFLDMATRAMESITIPTTWQEIVGITPDGRTALVHMTGAPRSRLLARLDIASRQLVPGFIYIGDTMREMKTVLTPDGQLVLAASRLDGTITVVDVPNWKAEEKRIEIPVGTMAIAVSPDGKYAFTVGMRSTALTIIDIAARRVEPTSITIPMVDYFHEGIAISPDGAFALVVTGEGRTITVVDLLRRTALQNPLQLPIEMDKVAITPNGKSILSISSAGDKNVLSLL